MGNSATPARRPARGRNDYRAVRREQSDLGIKLYDEAQLETLPTVRLLLKTDVGGSEEAILQQLDSLPQGKVKLDVLRSEVGDIVDSDIELAKTANATIVCFNLKNNRMVEEAERAGVRVWSHRWVQV